MLREVNPWRREFRDDFSRVAGALGPRDLAPLARAVSDFSLDGIRVYPVSSLSDGSGAGRLFAGRLRRLLADLSFTFNIFLNCGKYWLIE